MGLGAEPQGCSRACRKSARGGRVAMATRACSVQGSPCTPNLFRLFFFFLALVPCFSLSVSGELLVPLNEQTGRSLCRGAEAQMGVARVRAPGLLRAWGHLGSTLNHKGGCLSQKEEGNLARMPSSLGGGGPKFGDPGAGGRKSFPAPPPTPNPVPLHCFPPPS